MRTGLPRTCSPGSVAAASRTGPEGISNNRVSGSECSIVANTRVICSNGKKYYAQHHIQEQRGLHLGQIYEKNKS